MARILPETTETIEETANLSLPKVDRNGGTSGLAFAIVFHDAMDEIDTFLAAFDSLTISTLVTDVDQLELDMAAVESDIDDLQIDAADLQTQIDANDIDIANNDTDILALQNTKEDLATSATISNIVRDPVTKKITEYETALYRFQNPVYVDGKISTYEEIVNGVTTTVTVNRDIEGNILSTSVV